MLNLRWQPKKTRKLNFSRILKSIISFHTCTLHEASNSKTIDIRRMFIFKEKKRVGHLIRGLNASTFMMSVRRFFLELKTKRLKCFVWRKENYSNFEEYTNMDMVFYYVFGYTQSSETGSKKKKKYETQSSLLIWEYLELEWKQKCLQSERFTHFAMIFG